MPVFGYVNAIAKRIKGTNIGDIIVGSGANSIAKVGATGLGFVGSLLIARNYNAEMVGKIATISSLLSILSLFALLGNHTYILRTIPQRLERFGSNNALRVFLKIASLVLMSVCSVALAVKIGLSLKPELFKTAQQFQFLLYGLILVTCLKKISILGLRTLGDYKVFSIFELLPPLFMMLAVLLSISLNIKGDEFVYLYYTPHFVLAFLAFYIVLRGFLNWEDSTPGSNTNTASNELAELPSYAGILKVAIPMLGVTLSNAVITNTDILMLGTFTDEQTVGIYSIYVKISALMAIAITAVNSMYAPKASKLFGAGKIQELKVLTKRATFLSFTVSCGALACILLVHKPLLSLYGPVFSTHMPAFYILLGSMLCNSYFGSIGMLLNMTGKQNRFFIIMFTAALVNCALNYYWIPKYGPTGAALATLATVLFWNLLSAFTVKNAFGFTTFPAIRNR